MMRSTPPPVPRSPVASPAREGDREFRELDPSRDRASLLRLLEEAVPHDYVLGILDRFLATGGVLGGFQGDRLLAVQRLEHLGNREGWIGSIRVHPSVRRQGWGAELTRYAMAVAKTQGASVLRLTIEDANRASRALAGSLGFRPVAALAHTVGIAQPLRQAAPVLPLRPLAVPEVARISPQDLSGVRAVGGCMMATLPRPLRFVRASRERLELEAAYGRLLQAGPDPSRGLCVLAVPGQSGARDGRRFRLLVPLGSDAAEIFRASSVLARAERIELEGFLPSQGPTLGALERLGWRTGAGAFWGDRLHLYEARL